MSTWGLTEAKSYPIIVIDSILISGFLSSNYLKEHLIWKENVSYQGEIF